MRHQSKHAIEGQLDALEVGENVRVIVFKVVHDDKFRKIVDKFRPFIKKCGIVLVSFEHGEFALGEATALSKIPGQAADHKGRIDAGTFQNPRQQAGRCRFAMGASDHKITPTTQKLVFEQLRERGVKQATIQHLFALRISAANGIANHNDVGFRWNVGRTKTLLDRDPLALQE